MNANKIVFKGRHTVKPQMFQLEGERGVKPILVLKIADQASFRASD